MWNGGEEVNEAGEAVKLFIAGAGPRGTIDNGDSHIGGLAHQQDAPPCEKCEDDMYLLAQLRLGSSVDADASNRDRFISVFGCPRSTCCDSMTFENGFSVGGKGVMTCRTMDAPLVTSKPAPPSVPVAPVKSSWYSADGDDDDNDWAVDSNVNENSDGLAQLEDAVAAMEGNLKDGAHVKTKAAGAVKPKAPKSKDRKSFPCFRLVPQDEPMPTKQHLEEDDVGLAASDDKIRSMLARYMAEEDDEDILAVLKGTEIGGGGAGEEDERLSEQDRVLLGFQDRVRRAPRQVIRAARGGTPLWSIPSTKKGKTCWTVPPCSCCGAQLSFEFQLLPSMLHILEVDKSTSASGERLDTDVGISHMLSSGMNWGSVAVFACPNSCDSSEGVLVVQKSVDEGAKLEQGEGPRDWTPSMAVVDDLDDDADFEPYGK